MMFSKDDLRIVSGLDHVRAHPEMYLPRGYPDGPGILYRVVSDVLVESNRWVISQRIADWWVVASDTDWIGPRIASSLGDYFSQIIPFPEAGPNSMHSGILLGAFAEDVVTFDGSSNLIVKGQAAPTEPVFALRALHPEWKRVVAFRMSRESLID